MCFLAPRNHVSPQLLHINVGCRCQRLSKIVKSVANHASTFMYTLPFVLPQLTLYQHFELIPEHALQTAQSSLLNEITPEVNNLLTRVSTYLDKLDRREQSLVAKYELQQGRLDPQRTPESSRPASRARAKSTGGKAGAGLGMAEQMKMKQLRQKKERLQFAIDRLQLQAGQRERQLRKSMAVPQDIEF